MLDRSGLGAEIYLNPVYPKSFPDPFVFKFCGEYFAYCTGFASDGSVFPVLHSNDLVNWTERSGAMKPIASSPPYYWAPEVTYDNGNFYLYYSAGNEVFMELRVAVSDRPDGGFVDSGKRLTSEDFAIDAHVFTDGDGARYLFYATDFLEHSHIGTGTVVDRMLDWFTLEGDPRPVTRAKYDWQVYDPNRMEKGGVRWHTVEGPAVLKRKGVYYEMFSGGNWQNTTYGVSFAVAESLRDRDEWRQFSDGENVLPILRTMPGVVVGPGHNSVVRGSNNRERYCVYHRWIDDRRVMAIDRMDFAGKRIFIVGASHTPQPAPFEPSIRENFRSPQLAQGLRSHGNWQFGTIGGVSGADGRCEIELEAPPEIFLIELTWALVEPLSKTGQFGAQLTTEAGPVTLAFSSEKKTAILSIERTPEVIELPNDFVWTASHLLRIEVDCRRLTVDFDNGSHGASAYLGGRITNLTIFSEDQSSVLTSFELTEGFEELFEHDEPLTENGWDIQAGGAFRIEHGELVLDSVERYLITKGPSIGRLEIAANFRTLERDTTGGEFGLVLLDDVGEQFRLAVNCEKKRVEVAGFSDNFLSLPGNIQLSQYHQLRILKTDMRAICYFDDVCVGEFQVSDANTRASIFCHGVPVAVEMIRVTSI